MKLVLLSSLHRYTEQRAKDLITSAFSTPLDAPTEMVKFTFVVGGGKNSVVCIIKIVKTLHGS